MKKIIFVVIINLLALNLFAQNAKENIMMKMLKFKTALINKDSIALDKLMANDVTYGHSTGAMQTKTQLIHDIMSGAQDYKSIEPADMNIRVYENSAVVTMKSLAKLNANGKPLELSMNVTLVWVLQNGEWKLVARQGVKNN